MWSGFQIYWLTNDLTHPMLSIIDTQDVDASNQLTMSDIDRCPLIRRIGEGKGVKSYDLQMLIDNAKIDSAVYDCHRNQISGVTVKEYTSLLYVLNIIDEEGLQSEF